MALRWSRLPVGGVGLMGWMGRLVCVAAAVAALSSSGCGGYGTFCQERIDCEGGNEQDEEACVINREAAEEIADIEGCADDFATFFECVEEQSSCTEENQWTVDDKCADQEEKYNRCRG
jgi:hypothetical protein